MLVLSSPSGAGKTTIARRLLGKDPDIAMSVSHTTRTKRKGETDGKDYHFVDRDTFTRMRDEGAFLEWAVVFDNYYGTTRKPRSSRHSREGRDVLFDVDWQGAESFAQGRGGRRRHRVHPAAVGSRRSRSGSRRGRRIRTEVVMRRMRGASNEIQHWDEYDYVVVNYDIEQSVTAVRAILAAERLRRSRLTGLKDFVQNLLAEL